MPTNAETNAEIKADVFEPLDENDSLLDSVIFRSVGFPALDSRFIFTLARREGTGKIAPQAPGLVTTNWSEAKLRQPQYPCAGHHPCM